jgi:hypothetical protein
MKQAFSHRAVYFGIGLTALSTLMFELLLVRIFSVTLWYHFAFMAISIAMLGIGAGGIYVYLIAPARSVTDTLERLAISAMLFSATIVVALYIQLHIRFIPSFSLRSFLLLAQVYLVIAVPFFFGGLCISLALSQFSKDVSKLYFADLLGAGLGCFLVIPALSFLSGPNAVIVSAILAGGAAYAFSLAGRKRLLQYVSVGLIGACLILLVFNSVTNTLRIQFSKGNEEQNVLMERWNPFSRVILADWPKDDPFKGWGPSRRYSGAPAQIKMICIDSHASTPVYQFDGDFKSVETLAFDSTAVGYYLKNGSDSALIIGPGGGKDVLTALLFGIHSVYGVEINPSVVEIVKDDLDQYSGKLYYRDDVHIVVDEGRSYIARSKDKYDVIQASQVDSWAATAAGAFVLTENNLYTIEAFEEYYDHLADDGILTMTRFFFDFGGRQTLRLAALGYEAWKKKGVADPSKNIVVIRNRNLGTFILKKSAFTDAEIVLLDEVCKRMDYEIIASPKACNNAVLEGLYESGGSDSFYASLPFNLEPPEDDKPFFFHMLRLKNFSRAKTMPSGLAFNDNAIFVLGSLMIIITVLCLLFIFGPLWTFRRESLRHVRGKLTFIVYFSCLGVGFMMIEVPLMQKLLLFLGHPIYALSVTLFGLLIFSGIGSYLTSLFHEDLRNRRLMLILATLAVVLFIYILLLPTFIHRMISIPTTAKIPLVILGLIPLGLLLGMPFPMGIKLVDRRAAAIIPWVWGINGATSVFASVLAIVVALTWGFSMAMVIGLCSYALALVTAYFAGASEK